LASPPKIVEKERIRAPLYRNVPVRGVDVLDRPARSGLGPGKTEFAMMEMGADLGQQLGLLVTSSGA